MPAPKHDVGKQVEVDGKKGQVITVFDFGEDAEARYEVKIGKREFEVGEDQIVSDEPEVETAQEEAVDSGAEGEAVQAGSADRETNGVVAGVREPGDGSDGDIQPGN